MRIKPSSNPCPCGSTRDYPQCCGLYHAGAAAPDAEALMRSRYSAYVLCDEAYLLASWHPGTRPTSVPLSKDQKWLGLTVIAATATGEHSAEVEFIARSRVSNAAALRLHERSRFVREDGRWLYVDGDFVGPGQRGVKW